MLAGSLKTCKQFRIRLTQTAHSAEKLTIDLREKVVDEFLVLQIVGYACICLGERDRWKRVDDLLGSSTFLEMSDKRLEADTSPCDPKSTVLLVDIV